MGAVDNQSEDELFDFDMETDPPNWQQLVSREVLLGLKPSEIKRQEVINGKFLFCIDQIYFRLSNPPHASTTSVFIRLL